MNRVEFKGGDLVYGKLQPHGEGSLAKRSLNKLSERYYGLFPIEKKINPVD